MTDLETYLQRLGLHQYYDAFVAEGFETWEIVVDIQESDLEALNVKLGHRRRLQRAIAEYRGLANDRPLGSPAQEIASSEASKIDPGLPPSSNSKEASSSTHGEQKRKYRRHPKPDEHAPEKPPSAYVLFSNTIREKVKNENLSFTEIARLVGERWQKLEPNQKELFDSHATTLKDNYNAQLTEYKKTDHYADYMQYLADFKAKHAKEHDTKRPKLEQQYSSSLSAASGGEAIDQASQSSGHIRNNSLGSASNTSLLSGTAGLQLAAPLPNLNVSVGRRSSPATQSSQERRMLGQISAQSSLSDDYAATSTDTNETFSRAANLSIDTPPVGTPPPMTGPRSNRLDYGYGSSTQQWPLRQASYSQTPQASSTRNSGSNFSALSTDTLPHDQWRDRGAGNAEARNFYTGTVLQQQQQSSTMQISRLMGSESGPADPARTLPPLRQATGHPNSMPFSGFGGTSTANALQQIHPPEPIAFRRGPLHHQPNRSETEAADTLAALAETGESFDRSRTPRRSERQ